MRFEDLSLVVLQDHGAGPVKQAGRTANQGGPVAAAVQSRSAGLDADEPHRLLGNEGVKDADGVAAAADARHHHVGEPAELPPPLPLRLVADDGLEVPHEPREGMGSGGRPEQVVGRGQAGRPVAQRLVDRVLEGAGARGHGDDVGAAELHPLHVGGLALHVLFPHVDHRPHSETGGDHRGRGPVLSGASLRDQPGFAHMPGQERLSQDVVRLVGSAVEQVLALEDRFEAGPRREPGGSGERRRPPHPGARLAVQLVPEFPRGDDFAPGRVQLLERGGEEFRGETPPERTERALPGAEGGLHAAAGGGSRSKKRRSRSGSLTPGDDSIPLETSTPQGR